MTFFICAMHNNEQKNNLCKTNRNIPKAIENIFALENLFIWGGGGFRFVYSAILINVHLKNIERTIKVKTKKGHNQEVFQQDAPPNS